jgi:multimeric flavodoxin WrbA
MKKYFIYYSNSGNGDFVAEALKRSDVSLIKVEPKKHIKKMNFFRIIRYGGEAMMKKKMPIQQLDLILDSDDVVVIGSPIWNDRLSTPILTLLDKYEFDKKTTRFVFYSGGGKAAHAEMQIAKMGFEKKAIVLKEPKKYSEEAKVLLKDIF